MQLQDFAIFIIVPILLAPSLLMVHLSLRFMRWSQKNLFSETWLIWLAWLISSMGSYVVIAFVDFRTGVFVDIERVWKLGIAFTLIVLSNLILVGLTVAFLQHRRKSDDYTHILDKIPSPTSTPKLLKVTITATFAAVLGTVIGFFTLTQLNKVYDYYFPPMKPEGFQIYDI